MKMRCEFCGAKMSKNDDLCPECGKYAAKEAPETVFAEPDRQRNLGEIVRFFKCEEFAKNTLFLGGISGIIFIAPLIFMVIDNPNILKYLFGFYLKTLSFFILGVVLIIAGIISFFVFRKCHIGIKENGFYGRRPLFPLRTEYFEVFFEDIEDFKCHIPLGKGTPFVKFTAKGKKYTIACLNAADCSVLADCIRSAIDK